MKEIMVRIYFNNEHHKDYMFTTNTSDYLGEIFCINIDNEDITKDVPKKDIVDGCEAYIEPEFPVRLQEWWNFSEDVEEHIQEYTIPQYGDYPQDQLTTTTNECIVHDMKRYLNRFGKGQRGHREAMRDMLKIAQYAGVLYNRLQKDYEPSKSPFKPDYMKDKYTRGINREWDKDNRVGVINIDTKVMNCFGCNKTVDNYHLLMHENKHQHYVLCDNCYNSGLYSMSMSGE